MKYAVITTSSIHIPGDERSRTHPGHGYPAEDRTVINMQEFPDADSLNKWLAARSNLKSRGLRIFEIKEMLVSSVQLEGGIDGKVTKVELTPKE